MYILDYAGEKLSGPAACVREKSRVPFSQLSLAFVSIFKVLHIKFVKSKLNKNNIVIFRP